MKAILVQLNSLAVDLSVKGSNCDAIMFRKYFLKRLRSLKVGDPDEYDIYSTCTRHEFLLVKVVTRRDLSCMVKPV